jgi:hypothetical protein
VARLGNLGPGSLFGADSSQQPQYHYGNSKDVAAWVDRPGLDSISKALYRVFTWVEIEPIYGQPWAESIQKATEAHSEAAGRRRAIEYPLSVTHQVPNPRDASLRWCFTTQEAKTRKSAFLADAHINRTEVRLRFGSGHAACEIRVGQTVSVRSVVPEQRRL